MVETEAALSAAPFLQGDIIRLTRNNELSDPAYGIIINADCDLAHCRIDEVVSYLPIYPFSYYFERFWIPIYVASRRLELLNSVKQACGLVEDKYDSLLNWIREDEPATIVERLSKTYAMRATTLFPKISELATIERSEFFDSALLERLIEIQGIDRRETLAKLARRALKNMGDGHFFVNEITGLQELGFVVRMRRIYAINAEDVHPSTHLWMIAHDPRKLQAVRIAKLSSLYRFKVAQLFAYQFSRIGLPDEITELNQVAVEAAIFEIGKNQ
jgi:hypothetical protein